MTTPSNPHRPPPGPYDPPPPGAHGPPPGPYDPPPPGAYGPPPGPYGAPPRSKGPVVAIVVAAVVVVAGAVAAAVLLLGDDGAGGDTAAGSVEATAEALTQAWRDKDCAAYDALLTDRFRAASDPCRPDQFDGHPNDAETNPEIVERTDESATVELDVSEMDFMATYEVTIVNENGAWLVDDVKTLAVMG